MMRKFSYRSLMVPLFASAMAALVGCGSNDDDDEGSSPSPTPIAPVNDLFIVTSMTVGGPDEGVDIDSASGGDAAVDNNIQIALDEISSQILDIVEVQLCGDDGCGVDEKQQQKVLDGVAGVLDQVLSVEALSVAINTSIENGTRNYLVGFTETSHLGDATCNWSQGTFKSSGYKIDKSLAVQPGKFTEAGSGRFGPGPLTLTFEFAIPGQEPLVQEFVLYSGYSEVSGYNSTSLTNMLTGGAISLTDLLELVEQLLEAVNDAIPDVDEDGDGVPDNDIPVDDTIQLISDALVPLCDIDMDKNGDNDAVSIGIIVDGTITQKVD